MTAATESVTRNSVRCYWCDAESKPAAQWDVESFDADVDRPDGSVIHVDIEAARWKACKRCAPLVTARDAWGLARRSVAQSRARGEDPGVTTAAWASIYAEGLRHLSPAIGG